MRQANLKCPHCNKLTDVLIFDPLPIGYPHTSICRDCKSQLSGTYVNRSAKVVGCDSFNPHYDLQLDAYITSPEHKAHILKEKGYTQVAGLPSPRTTTGRGQVVCSKDQYSRAKRGNKI